MKPTDNELEMAIVAAREMRTSGQDEHHVAASLLYLYQRLDVVDKVRLAAENYLRSGREASRLAELEHSIAAVNRQGLGEIAAQDRNTTGE